MKKIILSVFLICIISLSLFAAEPVALNLNTSISEELVLKFTSDEKGQNTITEKLVGKEPVVFYASCTSNKKDIPGIGITITKIKSVKVASKIGYSVQIDGGFKLDLDKNINNDGYDAAQLIAPQSVNTKTTIVKKLTLDVDDITYDNAVSADDYQGLITIHVVQK